MVYEQLRTTNLNVCEQIHQKVKIDLDKGGIAEGSLRAEIIRMMEQMEGVRKSSPLKSSSLAIKPKTEAVTGRSNLKK